MTLFASPGDSVPLTLTMEDGATNVFPRAEVFTEAGAFVENTDLAHVSGGLFLSNYTVPGTALKYLVLFTVYLDAARTIVDPTHGKAETIVDAESLDQIIGADTPIVPSALDPDRL